MERDDAVSEETFIQIFSELVTIARRSLAKAIDNWDGIHKEISSLDMTAGNMKDGVRFPHHVEIIYNEIRASHSPIPLQILSSQDAPTQGIDYRKFSIEDLFRSFTVAFVILYSPTCADNLDTFLIIRLLRMANKFSFRYHNGRKLSFIKLASERSRDLRMRFSESGEWGKLFYVENWDHVGSEEILRYIIAHRSPLESISKQISSSPCNLNEFFPNSNISSILFLFRSLIIADSPPWCSDWQIPFENEGEGNFFPTPSVSEE